MSEDFRALRRLGFNTVFLYNLGGSGAEQVLETAESHGLHSVLPQPEVHYYVRTGGVPPGHLSLHTLAAQSRRSKATIVHLGLVTDAAAAERLRRIASLHHALPNVPWTYATIAPAADVDLDLDNLGVTFCSPMPIMTFEGPDEAWPRPLRGNLAVIRATRRESKDDSHVQGWLLAYHLAVASGQTRGLVFEQFRGSVEGWQGMVDAHGQLSARRASSIRRITERARIWGPRLRNTSATSIDAEDRVQEAIEIVLFAGRQRRYVMLINKSQSRFVRTPVELATTFKGLPAARLVRVPARGGTIVGEVYTVRQHRVTLATNLAPGDACLYEVF